MQHSGDDTSTPGAVGTANPDRLPGLLTAAFASIGAGTIHGAVSGMHTDHRQLLALFLAATVAQIGVGAWALLRPSRLAAGGLVAVNLLAVGAWMVTRMAGVSWIDGLEVREAPAFADTVCALLGALAVGAAGGAMIIDYAARHRPGRSQLALPAVAVAALTLPALWVGTTTTHSHGGHSHGPGTTLPVSALPQMTWPPVDTLVDVVDVALAAPAESTVPLTAHVAVPPSSAPKATGPVTTVSVTTVSAATGLATTPATTVTVAVTTSVPRTSAPATTNAPTTPPLAPTTTTTPGVGPVTFASSAATQAMRWPRPWDPAVPFDIFNVPGVSTEQEARAKQLILDTMRELPHWASTKTAIAEGYHSIGDAATGDEHYIKTSLIEDGVMLDPRQPESLVYRVEGNKRILAGAMFIASARPTDDPALTNFAGPLMTWHNHGNLCWAIIDGEPKVVGVTDAKGKCRFGVNTGGENPMVHVWIIPHECGPFAALEGVGAGQTSVDESKRTDKCNAANHHG